MEKYSEVIEEIHRLLKPGGYALVSFRSQFTAVFSDSVRILKTAIKALFRRLRPEPYIIGRFMDHRDVLSKMTEQGFEFRDFFGIGFGPIRFNNRPILCERTSIKISNAMARALKKSWWRAPIRWLADVSLWNYHKPRAGTDS